MAAVNNEIQEYINSQEVQLCKGELIIGKDKSEVDVPKGILDTAVAGFKNLAETKEHLKAAKNAGEEVFKVIIKPELQAGLKSGDLTWDGCSCVLKRADNKRIAGQIKVEKFEIDGMSKAQAVASGITKMICSVSGQIQIAEINKKLDTIQKTVNQIREEAWRDRISELNARSRVIRNVQAKEFMFKENEIVLIRDAILDIEKLVEFFRHSIENELVKKIQLDHSKSILEIVKYWFSEQKNDYNDAFINEVKTLLNDYSFLVDLYLEARDLLYICYQYIGEYPIATANYEESFFFIQDKNSELRKKVMYCFNLVDTEDHNLENLTSLTPLLECQGINISNVLEESDSKIIINNVLFGTNAEIGIDIPLSLLEADNYD